MAARLTIDLRDFRDYDLADVEITLSLPSGDRTPADSPEPSRFVSGDPISVWTDTDGVATIDLIPTTALVSRGQYRAVIPGVGTIPFTMPTAAASLYDLVGSSPLPARALPDPNSVADGDSIVSLDNAWQAGRFVSTGTTAPTAPTSGAAAIWVDTSTTPATWRYWTGTAWTAFELQPNAADSLHLAAGSVGTSELQDGAVTEPKLAAGAASTRVLADGGVTTAKIASGGLEAAAFASNSVTAAAIAPGAVGDSEIAPDSVIAGKIGVRAVEDGNIAHDAVGQDELKDAAVSRNNLASFAVGTNNIGDDQVTQAKIAAGAVGTSELEDGAVTGPKLAAGVVGSAHIGTGSVDTDELRDGAVTEPKLAGGAVSNRVIAAGAVSTAQLGDDAVTQSKIGGGAVGIGELHADASDRLLPTGGSQGQVLVKSTAVDGDAAWQAAASGGEDAATWAEAGNTDTIPRSKLPPEVFEQFVREHSFVISVASFGPGNEGRGFDRVTGGGGTASNASWQLDGQTLELVAAEQIATGLITISVHGTLPSNWNDRYFVVEDGTGFLDVLRIRDGTTRHEPGDTNYPAGLQTFTEITWSAQARNIIYTRSVGSTFTLSVATNPAEYLADQLASRDVGTAQIEDRAVTEPKLADGAVSTRALGDGQVTQAKMAANSVGAGQIRAGAVGNDQLANDSVDTDELRNNAVTGSKLDSNSVSAGNLNAGAVTTPKIADDAVTEAKLANDIVARLNPMGGAGGQSGDNPPSLTINLWTRRSSAPSVSELSSVSFDGTTFSNLPTGATAWYNSPASATGSDPLYEATTYAQWNAANTSYDIGTWVIHIASANNVQFSPNPNAVPPTITTAPTSASRWHRRRDPGNGNQWGVWLPFYAGESTWNNLATISLNRTSRTQNTIHNFPASFHGPSVRFFGVVVDCKHPPTNQTEWVDWAQISDYFLWPVNTGHTSELYNQPTAQFQVRGTSAGDLRLFSSAAALDDIPAASTSAVQLKFMLRGNASTGYISQAYVYQSGATGQAGTITLRYL